MPVSIGPGTTSESKKAHAQCNYEQKNGKSPIHQSKPPPSIDQVYPSAFRPRNGKPVILNVRYIAGAPWRPAVTWIDAGPADGVPVGGMKEIEAGANAVLLYNLAGTIFATSAICPHHAAWLSQGHIQGLAIDCPRHMGQFDIATGRQLRGPPCPDLRTYHVRIVADRIEVQV